MRIHTTTPSALENSRSSIPLPPNMLDYHSPLGRIQITTADRHTLLDAFFSRALQDTDPMLLTHWVPLSTIGGYSSDWKHPVISAAGQLLDRYFSGERVDVADIPIRMDTGTEFQREVWQVIRQIPYGEVRTYRWIAEQIGRPKAVRAVGNAVGANPVSILTPCHRVIRTDGGLGGYGSGIERKRRLLILEGYPVASLK